MDCVKNYYQITIPKKFLLLFWGLTVLTCACCKKDDGIDSGIDVLGEYTSKTIVHDDVERTYQVYLPNNFNKTNPTPMVFALHGGGGTANGFERDVSAGTLTKAAEDRGMILVMPDGIDKRWNDGRPEIFGNDLMYNDVEFISAIIDQMIQNYGVDADRVYVTGISNGGFMSVRLALDLSEKIAAVAPVTAQISKVMEDKQPTSTISIMVINGTDDPLVPYEGGIIRIPKTGPSRGEILSTQETIDKFIGFNRCDSATETQSQFNQNPEDGTEVQIKKYSACADGTEVILVKIIGGGHTWPSGTQYLPVSIVGEVSKEINASEIILDFFLSHRRN